jgi:peptidoglycan/LPS O-acetylase OafA/YrhL
MTTARGAIRSTTRMVRVGLVLFVLGLVAIAVDVLPFFASDHDRPLWLNLLCLLAPLGFAVAVVSALRAGREDQRAAVRRAATQHPLAD